MNKTRLSYRNRPATANRVGMRGDIQIAICPAGTFEDGENISVLELHKNRGAQLLCTHNLETDYVLQGIAKALAGESAIPLTGTGSITPLSMAVGSGTSPVTASDTALASELLRKAVTVTRMGSKIVYKITLTTGEALGNVGCLGLFGSDGGAGATATGSITLGGTAASGNLVRLTLDGRGIPPYGVGSTNLTTVAAGLKDWLNADGDFGSLFTCTSSGSVVSISARGKGTVYNSVVGVSTSGTITATAAGVSGGATPGGQLLAAANTFFNKDRNTQLMIEWTVSITN